MLQEIALFLCVPCGCVWTSNSNGVSQVDSLSPISRNTVSVQVQVLVLKCRIAGAHQIVQQHAGSGDQLDCLWAMLHHGWKCCASMPEAFSTTRLALDKW